MSKRYVSPKKKRFVLERSDRKCEYCLCLIDFIPDPYTIEHIISLGQGGTNDIDNLAIACFGCNLYKQDKITAIDPLTDTKVSLYNPRIDKWKTHFSWNEDFTEIIGLTPIGRASVIQLKLNRTGLINIRKLLIMYGEHPPK